MNKNHVLLAIAVCLSASLHASFPADLQRNILGKDPVAAKGAAAEALLKFGNNPLKLMTYTGKTVEQLKQMAAGTTTQLSAPAAPGELAIVPYKAGTQATQVTRAHALKPAEALELARSKQAASKKAQPLALTLAAAEELNPLAGYPGLEAVLDKISVAQLAKKPKYNEILVANPRTTAEDVYKRVLGVPEDYNQEDVDAAYKEESADWEEFLKENRDANNQAYGKANLELHRIAYDGLTAALKERAGMQLVKY